MLIKISPGGLKVSGKATFRKELSFPSTCTSLYIKSDCRETVNKCMRKSGQIEAAGRRRTSGKESGERIIIINGGDRCFALRRARFSRDKAGQTIRLYAIEVPFQNEFSKLVQECMCKSKNNSGDSNFFA